MTATLASLFVRPLLAACLLLTGALALAGAGHDHDAPAPAAGSASPRIDAHSDLFELVGIVDHGRMTLYLDRYASNEPVTGATIAFEAGADKGTATPQVDGTYLVQFDALGKPGALSFAFTVSAGADTDLLAADLTIADPDAHGHADAAAGPTRAAYAGYAAYAGAGALALVVLALVLRKSRAARTAA